MRIYSVNMNAVAVTAAITLVQIKAGASSLVKIVRAWCSQSNITTSGMQRIQIVRKSAAATVTSFTPLLINCSDDVAAKAVGGTSSTGTNASAEGTDTDVDYPDAFNLLNGWLWIPTPEERIIVPPAGFIALKLPAAPAASTTISAGFWFGEEG